jgi:hypothetical protein
MKITLQKLLNIVALGALAALTALTAHAGSTVVLEGFENGFLTNSEGQTNLAVFNGYGVRGGGDAVISVYTATDPSDPRVTQGTNSMKVVFPVDGFGNDMTFALSDAAATLLENAVSSNQVARYILRYDIVFENYDELSYYNQHFLIANDWEYARSAGAVTTTYTNGITYGTTTFSVPVELPGIGLPDNPPSANNAGDFAAAGITGATAIMVDQFAGVTEPLTNFTIYIDNVRLVDTYATPATVPVVTSLQSFEGSTNLLDVAAIGPGVTVSQYTTNGQYNATADGGVANVDTPGYPDTLSQVSDFSVTSGTNSLEVTVANPYYSYGIFTLTFPTNDLLAQLILSNNVPSKLTNYTLRFDVTTPMVNVLGGAGDGDYINIDYNGQNASAFPMSTGRRQSTGQTGLQRETYSLTLDQIPYWPNSTINFSYSAPAANWGAAPFYLDNFVLINTAPTAPTVSITSESYNSTTKQFTLTWQSAASKTYSVKFASNLLTGFTNTLETGIASGGTSTTTTVTTPGGSAGYLLVTSP